MRYPDNYGGPEPAPELTRILRARWGEVGDGWPVYRIVDSAHVFEKIGGRWHVWDENLNIQDRGGIVTGADGRPAESPHSVDRVYVGLIEVQTYVELEEHGWILEGYYPPAYFGSPVWWESQVVPGTRIPLLGPYPCDGRYLKLVGPFRREPPISFLEDVIADRDAQRASWPRDAEQFVRMRVDEATKREEAKSDHAIRENTDRLVDSASPLLSTSLEAGRWRSQMFEKSGHTSHIGN